MEKTNLYESIFSREMSLIRELWTTAAVFSVIFLLTHAFIRFSRRKKQAGHLPPGLPSVPFLGSMPFLPQQNRMHAHEFFTEKAQELGPVFTVNFLNRLGVVINGREMIHEAFAKQSLNFASRPFSFTNTLVNPGRKGLANHQYDPLFRKYHQLSLNILKKFGFGKRLMESRIQVEVEDVLARIQELNGKATSAHQFITRGVANVIISILLGERFEHSSPVLAHLIEIGHEFASLLKDRIVVDYFPAIRFLPKYRTSLKSLVKVHDEILKFIGSKIDAGLKGELPESFITHFLQMEGPEFDRDQLMFILRDFLLPGTETTATALQWALILLANHPDIQQRLRTEIDSVVQRERLPSLEDRRNLPFTEAVILELLRIKSPVPLGLPHETLADTQLNGHFLPKGILIIANLYSANMDQTIWKDPDTFNPERFLSKDGKVVNKESVVSFSLGRRSCIGELLAQQELFLFLTGMVQHFEIRPPDGQSTVAYKEHVGVAMVPTDYELRMLQRWN